MFQEISDDEVKKFLEDEAMKLPDMGVAVSGIAGRFPKADSVNEFEGSLLNGVDMMSVNDSSRFESGLWDLPKRAGLLKDLTKFDHEFFGLSTQEANDTDHQVRILLEVIYEAIMDAGVNPAELRGSKTGVFLGSHCNEFENTIQTNPNAKAIGYFSQQAVKVAQVFDLRGITACYDTACASGFTAFSSAVEAMNGGLVDQAIVASSIVPVNPSVNKSFLMLKMLSPTGFGRYLDSRADGYVKSEACVAIFLQRKSLALRNYCSVMAALTNADGCKPEGITFPSVAGQERLMREAIECAGISTNNIEYIEAHGTGTTAGDPIESGAIANVYFEKEEEEETTNSTQPAGSSSYRRKIGPLLAGSCKTNMGHPEGASGLCALTKVALMLENELIYKSLHYEKPNPNIPSLLEGKLKPVLATTKLRAKIIPMSNYGFGGANVHVIVRSSGRPAINSGEHLSASERSQPRLILMFGRSEQSVHSFFNSILDEKSRHTRNCLTDDFLSLVDSLSKQKIDRLMNYRGYLIVDRREVCEKRELARDVALCSLAWKEKAPDLNHNNSKAHIQEAVTRLCNLILPGLGCQWAGMAAGLIDYEPFWRTIKRLSGFLNVFGLDLAKLMIIANEQELNQSLANIFVAIVGYEVALINIIRDQLQVNQLGGIVGHSLGEVASAYAAGLLDERETIITAYQLGKTLDENKLLIAGKMVALATSEEEALRLMENYKTLRVSCVNGPQSVTISGSVEDIDSFCSFVSSVERTLHTVPIESCSIALHNDLIMSKEVKVRLQSSLLTCLKAENDYNRGSKPQWISTITSNTPLLSQANADYFAENLCNKVNFYNSVKELENDSIALELGPGGMFESQLRGITYSLAEVGNKSTEKEKFHYVKLMQKKISPDKQLQKLLEGLGKLYLVGATFEGLTGFSRQEEKEKETTLIPVKRQTPSLSSLFRWKHDKSFFVPRYPAQFSKAHDICRMSIDLHQEHQKYIIDHKIEGRILFPATGYLKFVWQYFARLKSKIFNPWAAFNVSSLIPVEFYNVRLLSAAVLSKEQTTEIELYLNEETGRFEISESGTVLVHGFIRAPLENPQGLLYDQVRESIEAENLDGSQMSADDVYKQFRVSGYDYGHYFQNILSSSADGRFTRVRYNNHFDAFTDSVLQAVFLAMKQYSPNSGLFLPTGFDYVRFQPSILLRKLAETNTRFERPVESDKQQLVADDDDDDDDDDDEKEANDEGLVWDEPDSVNLPVKDDQSSVFDVYCDPLSGIIVTDGVEMRGIKVTPAPRRSDNKDILLESYQFVKDTESPIKDPIIEKSEKRINQYVQVCNSMSVNLLAKIYARKVTQLRGLDYDFERHLHEFQLDQEQYLGKYLNCLYNPCEEPEKYDIKKNGHHLVMSILDQLLKEKDQARVSVILAQTLKVITMNDLIQRSFVSERMLRSVLETVVENVCLSSNNLRVLEINQNDDDSSIMKGELIDLLDKIEPSLSVEYLLPKSEKKASNSDEFQERNLKKFENMIKDGKLRQLDLVIYTDTCPVSPDPNEVSHLMSSLCTPIKDGGFLMIALRQEMTLAERLLIQLEKEPITHYGPQENLHDANEKLGCTISRLNQSNKLLELRFLAFLNGAEKSNLILGSNKCDQNGCRMLLFRKRKEKHADNQESCSFPVVHNVEEKERVLIRVTHDGKENIGAWLESLKKKLKSNELVNEEDRASGRIIIWLCAVETLQQPVSGLIGMMQALRKELEPSCLRCFYDAHSFRNSHEPITEDQIENSANFQLALDRDFVWNCIDSDGNFGSFRHFTINEFFDNDDCLCRNNPVVNDTTSRSNNAPITDEEEKEAQYAYVNYAKRGDLSSFSWFEAPFKYLEEKDRENMCQVAYSTLNFRDIMLASGRLSLEVLPIEVALQDCMIGMEFSGFDSQKRRVMGMVSSRAIGTHVICRKEESLLINVPDWMSLEEAATIPVVYATAMMAIKYRGRAQRGESILIHAGSGGVGQAAIRLASHYGLTIYTTVGSEEKKRFLLEEFGEYLSEERIFSSRDCIFEERIMGLTGGQGVDLVLNSLSEEKLLASVRCLADGGRFLEIGKYDMSIDSQLELLKLDTNKTFHGISLDKLFDINSMSESFKKQIHSIVECFEDGLQRGYVKPIRHVTFSRDKVEEAFRFMATGKHIGKVLIEVDSRIGDTPPSNIKCRMEIVARFQLCKEKSYIVTGGLGGFGVELIKWMVGQGARNIVLTSRKGITTSYQSTTLDRLAGDKKARFVVVDKVVADTTTPEGVEKLCELALDMSPTRELGGVFHLAMVLKDSLLENMSPEDFDQVCRPKVDTFVHLDRVTRELRLPLDYFVGFSSVTSGKGNAGQANYAYANSCLERICERRRSQGLHGLAIQWGAIGDVGVAFENLGGNDIIIGGTIPQRIPSCMSTLSKLLCSPFAVCLSVVPANKSSKSIASKDDLVEAVLNVLGIKDKSKITPSATLGELGLDSLMAVEIRQYIQREYELTLTFQETRSLTLDKINRIAKEAATKSSNKKNHPTDHSQKSHVEELRNVESYGTQKSLLKSSDEKISYSSLVLSNFVEFLPSFKLPERDLCLLNGLTSNGASHAHLPQYVSQQPIFFLPPFHGEFKELEKVCAGIARPCIGINWTKNLFGLQTIDCVVKNYLNLIENTNWPEEFGLDIGGGSNELVVDLVGYSFGATMAFEMMVSLQRQFSSGSKKLSLRPGKLILLDGSPKECELYSFLLNEMTKNNPMALSEKLDELLMVYVSAQAKARKCSLDYVQLQVDLAQTPIESKSLLASKRMFQASSSGSSSVDEISKAMDAFCQHFLLMEKYRTKPTEHLNGDCLLIRAEKSVLKLSREAKDELDLGLSLMIDGRMSSLKFNGNHATFLDENHQEIIRAISDYYQIPPHPTGSTRL